MNLLPESWNSIGKWVIAVSVAIIILTIIVSLLEKLFGVDDYYVLESSMLIA